MEIRALDIADVKLITPVARVDVRGHFAETFRRDVLLEAGIVDEFVQDNHSLSRAKGVVRGLHLQTSPHAQGKLVRVLRGAIFDVAVDVREGSASFGQHVSAVLSAENWAQLWIPVGFAHGFCTMEPDTEVLYKTTDYYQPSHEVRLRWDDPALDIAWPIPPTEAILSEQDREALTLASQLPLRPI